MRWACAAVVIAAVISGCGSGDEPAKPEATATTPSPEPVETFDVDANVITLNALAIAEEALDGVATTTCDDLSGKYAPLQDGGLLTLKDAQGSTVGVAELGDPVLPPPDNVCAWSATFTDVEAGGEFYSISIGEFESAPRSEADVRQSLPIVMQAE